MPDIIDFPGRHAPSTDRHSAEDRDFGYVVDTLKGALPADALARIAGRDLELAARKVIRRIDEVRVGRVRDPVGYDRSQSHGVEDALRNMVGPGFDPDGPDCA